MPEETQSEDRAASEPSDERFVPARLPFVAVFVFLAIGLLIGSFIPSPFRAANPPGMTGEPSDVQTLEAVVATLREQNWTLSRQRDALQDTGDDAVSGEQAAAPSLPEGTFGEGIYRVGEDIQPGEYDGVVVGKTGYWARLRATDGTVGSIIANALPAGPFALTINPSDAAIELRGVEITER